MGCIINGSVNITSNEGYITSNVGFLAPASTSKTVTGAGSFNTGNVVSPNNFNSVTRSVDPDAADSNVGEGI